MAKRKRGVGPSNSFGYQGSFGNPPKPGVGPSNSFGYHGSFGNGGSSPNYTPPTPGLPSSPGVAPQPVDPYFEAQKIGDGRQLQVGTAMDAWQGANLEYDSGFGTDQSNPYSQANLLEESYKRSKLGTTNNYASSGQLHSGAYGRMQGENDRNYSIGVHQGKIDLARGQQGIAFGGLQRSADYGTGISQGDWEALMNAFKTKFG